MPNLKTTGKQQGGGKADGRFKRGESGNPAGRPKGCKNRAQQVLQEMLADEGQTLIRKLITLAKKGDTLALRLVIDRILPRATPSHVVEFELPRLTRAGDIVEGLASVLRAAGAGEISLEEARQFAAILEGQRKAIETAELEVRIEALEKHGAEEDE